MIIVVEGPDFTGKTTLATRLAKDLEFNYVKMRRLSEPEAVHLSSLGYLLSYMTVFDRNYYLSEHVYGNVIRNEGYSIKTTINRFISQFHREFKLIFCYKFAEGMEKSEQMPGVLNNKERIHRAYMDLMDGLNSHIKIYYYDHSLSGSYNLLLEWLRS